MRILHTSDWHLGRSLYNHKRYDEFANFLDWLADTIEDREIDVLLVAGDIFDTGMPSNRAQKLYYQFLNKASQKGCKHIVITGGNHDSPTFLNAPKILLEALNIHVIGSVSDNLEDEIIVLNDEQNQPKLIICAVPYLRDKDIRTVEVGESLNDKNQNMIDGIKAHYEAVYAIAKQKQLSFVDNVPIIAMGHLFATGGKVSDDGGVRELYVGSLARITEDCFPKGIDYVALGHLHIPQKVGKREHIRYSGSPIAMGYGEASQQKQVIEIQFIKKQLVINELPVPCFQPLLRIKGSLSHILAEVKLLKQKSSDAWLEIEYSGTEVVGDLQEQLNEAIAYSLLKIIRIRNQQIVSKALTQMVENETLAQLNETEVFMRCLDSFNVPYEQREMLLTSYQEIIHSLSHEDHQAE
ncbi:exonuclease SbcCD subunit D C-terminal domain-containing protein [Gilliamella apis]|uniref:exonuclease SbcCD subunit D C-terminal domain-containing protein n=1 Tax=Gilliamella apis TaxID=1970738 RepID=UPI00080DC728|nr:exonuclease SbcCD subunit D C-terminal domain-containing protein [Gilliamella apis]OCG02754.1 exonuclease sbcCD subunit D [Gilliamella apis]